MVTCPLERSQNSTAGWLKWLFFITALIDKVRVILIPVVTLQRRIISVHRKSRGQKDTCPIAAASWLCQERYQPADMLRLYGSVQMIMGSKQAHRIVSDKWCAASGKQSGKGAVAESIDAPPDGVDLGAAML